MGRRSWCRWMLNVTVCAAIALVPSSARAHEGHIVWGPWEFDWDVTSNAGINIRHVTYNGKFFLWRGNMPVIRVRYDNNNCGPYADMINWDKLVKISNCGDRKVCVDEFTQNGKKWLELGVYARIGSYHLYQVWYFDEAGNILPRLFSKGLQCHTNHVHHPYWRLDFDVNAYPNDQIRVYTQQPSGWVSSVYQHEQNDVKDPNYSRVWNIRDTLTNDFVWVWPGLNPGTADGFSNKDVGLRRYHSDEDRSWAFGASGHLGYNNGENISGQDVVFWWVSHLEHKASQGGSVWHETGPTVRIVPNGS